MGEKKLGQYGLRSFGVRGGGSGAGAPAHAAKNGARPGPQNVRLARARRPAAPDVLRSFQKSRYRLVSCGRRSRRVEKCVTFLR
ncbi:hypothetical protein EVAR_38151_1 [Eumeta japonica]|uniref:Uncharacterized protein n=1 Tax=Eumeta variegata TaxID=151549 RepID=A0A4C1ZMC0_EUMVA|nr:hypothetical protein EVAR_38151_1 [Eumeta japonica]